MRPSAALAVSTPLPTARDAVDASVVAIGQRCPGARDRMKRLQARCAVGVAHEIKNVRLADRVRRARDDRVRVSRLCPPSRSPHDQRSSRSARAPSLPWTVTIQRADPGTRRTSARRRPATRPAGSTDLFRSAARAAGAAARRSRRHLLHIMSRRRTLRLQTDNARGRFGNARSIGASPFNASCVDSRTPSAVGISAKV